ncbi:hypothetical protein SLA2020_494720 [Shorea laevis]
MQLSLVALPINKRSSAKKRWERMGPPLPALLPFQQPTTDALVMESARNSMHRMKIYGESGSPCRIPLEGRKVPADEHKEMEKLITQNGGKYSPELTRKCSHLICDISFTPEGDKDKVAQRWDHIHIVTQKWCDQSIARRACLNQDSYPVQSGCASLNKSTKGCLRDKCSDVKFNGNLLSDPSSVALESTLLSVPAGFGDPNHEAMLSKNMSVMFSDAQVITKGGEAPPLQPTNETKLDGCVADDS